MPTPLEADKHRMNRISSKIERIVAGLVLGIAFLTMASIIVPSDSQATFNEHDAHTGDAHHPGGAHTTTPGSHDATHADVSGSTLVHADLVEIGTLETSCYLVRIYAGSTEPRYTIIDLTNGEYLGELLTAPQVEQFYPELPITDINFDAPISNSGMHIIMSAEPTDRYDFR
jgi:hypothetical protein